MAAIVAPQTIPLDQMFDHFSKFGDTKSIGTTITLSQIDKWFKQAKIIDKKSIVTPTDTGIAFNKYKTRTITYEQFLLFLEDLCHMKNQDLDEMKDVLMNCGLPGTVNITLPPVKIGNTQDHYL